MYKDGKAWIAQSESPVYLLPQMANRHGLIAGATGTGKTVTLKVMAEAFSEMGVPVFLADIKGDLSGLSREGSDHPKVQERVTKLGLDEFSYRGYPVRFWDLFGENGHPVQTTVSEMGSVLLARLLDLNEVQTGVLSIVFRIADEKGLLLLDLKDLRAMIQYVGDHAREFTLQYGTISTQSVGAILRSLLTLEEQGGEVFFGEPALDIYDWMQLDPQGRGTINILDSVRLFGQPALYSTFLLWMMAELFETLPEAGDLDKPKLVFFFDEAHLLFRDAPKALLQKVEQVVRLIRSKGIGVYFITQNPADLPQEILSQLGNRVQHALRAYTPADQRLVEAAAETFRTNPDFDTATVLLELATGEALISFLEADGRPQIVQRAMVLPPQSLMGSIDDQSRKNLIAASPVYGKYEREVDRDSAFELLRRQGAPGQAATMDQNRQSLEREPQYQQPQYQQPQYQQPQYEKPARKSGYTRQTPLEKVTNAVVTTIGREIGRQLIRGILGSLKK